MHLLSKIKNRHVFLLCIFLVGIFYLIQTFYFAKNIHFNRFPDERHHIELSTLYKGHVSLLPLEDNSETYKFGLVQTAPYLYNTLMGNALSFNVTPFSDLTFLRLINV